MLAKFSPRQQQICEGKFQIKKSEINEICSQQLMNDSLIYPFLVQLMKILDQKQRNQPQQKPFYYTQLILRHFVEGKQMFNQSNQIYKVYLHYYRERWILKEQAQIDSSQSCAFLRQIKQQNEKDRLVCQIVVRLLNIGIQAIINVQTKKEQIKQLMNICQDLHLALVFQGIGISEILLQFVQKITTEIKNLVFYQTLLKMFRKLDYYQIITFLEDTIQKLRQEWNKNQQQMKMNFMKKKNRQSIFLPSPKRNISLSTKQNIKQNNPNQQNPKSSHKSKQKSKQQAPKSTFKLGKTAPKIPPSNHRKSIFYGKSYKFNSRTSTADLNSSNDSVSFSETKFSQQSSYRIVSQSSLSYSHHQRIDEKQEDILADNTPQKKKKKEIKRQ